MGEMNMAGDAKPLRCVYLDCGEKADGMLVINTEGGWTLPLPVDRQHADYQGKLVSITYLADRDPQVQVEYLPEEAETSIAACLAELYKGADSNHRGVWRRMWAEERHEKEHMLDLMADLLFGLGVPLHRQSPLALPGELKIRLVKLWTAFLQEPVEEVQMMIEGSVTWIKE